MTRGVEGREARADLSVECSDLREIPGEVPPRDGVVVQVRRHGDSGGIVLFARAAGVGAVRVVRGEHEQPWLGGIAPEEAAAGLGVVRALAEMLEGKGALGRHVSLAQQGGAVAGPI